MLERTVIVKWRAGLHARRAVDLVNVANKYQSNITVRKDDLDADAKSILNIMTLEASYKTTLLVISDGVDEEEAMKAIINLFDNFEE